jgi:hypothetical protein
MKKKELGVKSIWNSRAKLLQEKYFCDFCIKIAPFLDQGLEARLAEIRKEEAFWDVETKERLVLGH